MMKRNLLGERFGIIEVIEETNKTKYKKKSMVWVCKCDCGKIKEYSSTELLCGIKSCGCLRRKNMDAFGERNKGKEPVFTLPLGESTKRAIYKNYIRVAKKRKIDFSITTEQFRQLISQNCFYCGCEPSQIWRDTHREGGDIVYNGIDRIDSSLGYEYTNCVSCCRYCNQAKSNMTMFEFKDWIRKIFHRLDYF